MYDFKVYFLSVRILYFEWDSRIKQLQCLQFSLIRRCERIIVRRSLSHWSTCIGIHMKIDRSNRWHNCSSSVSSQSMEPGSEKHSLCSMSLLRKYS